MLRKGSERRVTGRVRTQFWENTITSKSHVLCVARIFMSLMNHTSVPPVTRRPTSFLYSTRFTDSNGTLDSTPMCFLTVLLRENGHRFLFETCHGDATAQATHMYTHTHTHTRYTFVCCFLSHHLFCSPHVECTTPRLF